MGALVAVKVFNFMGIVILFSPNHNAIAFEAPHSAFVGTIGRTDKSERIVKFVLVAVDLFPIPVWIMGQGIINPGNTFQKKHTSGHGP
jgi:hypothetical protein